MSPAAAPLRLLSADDLDLAAVERVAWERQRLVLEDELLASVAQGRGAMLRALQGRAVYGVTTGMGYLADEPLDAEAAQTHQRRLLLGRAVGGPPWLPREEVRALMAVRLAELLRGRSGASPELCQVLVDRLNDGLCPAVPARGIGAAGEIQPLAHAFQTLMGVGWVLEADGHAVPAAEALAARGASPYEPSAREGLALIAGAPGAPALALARARDAAGLARIATWSAAAAIDAIDAPRGPYDPRHADLAGDAHLAGVLAELSALLPGGRDDVAHQAPVSFRVAPQALAHLRRAIARAREDAARRLGAVTDSPVLLGEGVLATSGAFHAIDVAADLDALAVALAHLGELAVQRTHRLLDPRVTGLAAQLAGERGGCGLVVVHKRAVAAAAALRRLAEPRTVGLVDTSLGQEDAQAFTFEAADRLREVEARVAEALACELLCVRQAWWLADHRPQGPLATLCDRLVARVAPVAEDRPLGEDLDALAAAVQMADLVSPADDGMVP